MSARIIEENETCYRSPSCGDIVPVYAVAVDASSYEEAWELAKLAAQNHFVEAEMKRMDTWAFVQNAIAEAIAEYNGGCEEEEEVE